MATARKIASGNYRCLVYIGKDNSGKRVYKSFTHKDKRKCERMADEYADMHRRVSDKYSFETAAERFVASRKAVLSPSTIRGYTNILNRLKNDYSAFYRRSITGITKSVLQDLVNEMSETMSPKTVRNRIGFISSVLKESDMPVPNVVLPEKQKADLKIPDTKEVEKIIEAAKGTEMEIPILLAAFGPMRRSEIAALELDDISGNTIHVKRAVVIDESGNNVIKTTKTYDSNRYIPMSEKIIEKIIDKGYVTSLKNPQLISQRFEHIAKQAGCMGTRFHDLRHWCASYLHAQGVPDQYIMARGGWKTDRVMKAVYMHELSSEKNIWSEKINTKFEMLMDTK